MQSSMLGHAVLLPVRVRYSVGDGRERVSAACRNMERQGDYTYLVAHGTSVQLHLIRGGASIGTRGRPERTGQGPVRYYSPASRDRRECCWVQGDRW